MKNLLFALCLWLLALSAAGLELAPSSRKVNLLEGAQYLEDPSGQLSLEQIQGLGAKFQNWHKGGTEMNFGFTRSAYWVRIPLQRMQDAPRDWLLELHYVRLGELDFYPPQGQAVFTGSARPFNTRPYHDRLYVFPLAVDTKQEYVYLRMTSRYALTAPLTLWEPNAYRQQQQVFVALQFMYHGGLLVLGMYGLLIFLALRDRIFLIYAAYIAFISLGMFASNGFGRQMLWPESPAFDEVAQNIFFSLAGLSLLEFVHALLLPSREGSWLHKCLRWSQWAFGLAALLSVFHMVWPIWQRPGNQLVMLIAIIMGLVVNVAGVSALRKQRPGVLYFMLSWAAIWLGVGVATMRAFGILPSNGLTSYALQWSTLIETVLMAIALGNLLSMQHKSHIATREQALQDRQNLLELSQAGEEKLKQAVIDRTAQLESALRTEKNLREQYVRFGSMISHEFRTPLGIIQSQASLMRKEYEHGIDQVEKRLAVIGSAAQRLKIMFDKWLHSDGITQTLEVLEPKNLDIQPWLRTLAKSSEHLLINHSVDLKFSADIHTVMADEYHLGVALTNLIDNATKYAPANTLITLLTCSKPGHVGFAVSDSGPGIAPEVQDKVFDDFFRISPESQIRGVGLGLSIVKRIAEAHGGHVQLTSTPGQGATFCIWLPDTAPEELT